MSINTLHKGDDDNDDDDDDDDNNNNSNTKKVLRTNPKILWMFNIPHTLY